MSAVCPASSLHITQAGLELTSPALDDKTLKSKGATKYPVPELSQTMQTEFVTSLIVSCHTYQAEKQMQLQDIEKRAKGLKPEILGL